MNTLTSFVRLVRMRRRAGCGLFPSLHWAASLLWRDHQINQRRQHIERRADVERRARQRL